MYLTQKKCKKKENAARSLFFFRSFYLAENTPANLDTRAAGPGLNGPKKHRPPARSAPAIEQRGPKKLRLCVFPAKRKKASGSGLRAAKGILDR